MLYDKGWARARTSGPGAALPLYVASARCAHQAHARDGDDDALAFAVFAQNAVAEAYLDLGMTRDAAEQDAALVAAYLDDPPSEAVSAVAVAALRHYGRLFRRHAYHEALDVCDRIAARCGARGMDDAVRSAAYADLYAAGILERLGRQAPAYSRYAGVVSLLDSTDDVELQRVHAAALYNQGDLAASQGRGRETKRLFEELVRRHGRSDDSELADYAAGASAWLDEVRSRPLLRLRLGLR